MSPATAAEELTLLPLARPRGVLRYYPVGPLAQHLPAKLPGKRMRSIDTLGVLQTVVVVEGPSVVLLAAGRRRVRDAVASRIAEIPANVITVASDAEAQRLAAAITLVENDSRSDNPACDVDQIETLVRDGFSEKEVADELGIAATTLKKRLRLLDLLPELREGFRNGTIAPSVAEDAAALDHSRQRELVLRLARNGKLTGADVRDVRQAAVAEALSALPADIFGGPALSSPAGTDPWGPFRTALSSAATLLPAGDPLASTLRDQLNSLAAQIPTPPSA